MASLKPEQAHQVCPRMRRFLQSRFAPLKRLNAVKLGDKVAFAAERMGEDMTIKTLTRE
jgi:hypothetical protein